jgi:hypothetical protein
MTIGPHVAADRRVALISLTALICNMQILGHPPSWSQANARIGTALAKIVRLYVF